MKRIVINIFGKVQMVGFRYATLQKANELNIRGFVDNLRDGSVEVEAQGEESGLDKFIEWCNIGPPYSNIAKVIVEEMEVQHNEESFEIL